jgi:hypothetical protein
MFVACFLIASGCIKDHWIVSEKHPAYSSRTFARPIHFGSDSHGDLQDPLQEKKDEAVSSCAVYRELVRINQVQLLNAMAESGFGSGRVARIRKTIESLEEQLGKFDELLKEYPELEKQIEEAQSKIKLKNR